MFDMSNCNLLPPSPDRKLQVLVLKCCCIAYFREDPCANTTCQLRAILCVRVCHPSVSGKFFISIPMMQITAVSCLYLAAKMEEHQKSLRDTVNVFHHLMQLAEGKTNPDPLEYQSDKFYTYRKKIVTQERLILRDVAFVLHVEHPHKYVVNYLNQLEQLDLAQTAWNYLNDRFVLCLSFVFRGRKEKCVCLRGALFSSTRRNRR